MNIITGKLMPDEGKVEWAKNVRVGYLDQHTVLTPGMTIRQVLASAFDFLYDMEAQMNEICDKMGDATPEELEQYMEDLGTIQDLGTLAAGKLGNILIHANLLQAQRTAYLFYLAVNDIKVMRSEERR